MNDRYFWGAPHTDAGANAFEAAMRTRAAEVAHGSYAAAAAVQKALEQLTRRSSALLQADVLFAVLTTLMVYQAASAPAAAAPSLLRWAFGLMLTSGLLLLPNLALVWASNPGQAYANPSAEYHFSLKIYRMRAARYTVALCLSVLAFVLTLVWIAPMK